MTYRHDGSHSNCSVTSRPMTTRFAAPPSASFSGAVRSCSTSRRWSCCRWRHFPRRDACCNIRGWHIVGHSGLVFRRGGEQVEEGSLSRIELLALAAVQLPQEQRHPMLQIADAAVPALQLSEQLRDQRLTRPPVIPHPPLMD